MLYVNFWLVFVWPCGSGLRVCVVCCCCLRICAERLRVLACNAFECSTDAVENDPTLVWMFVYFDSADGLIRPEYSSTTLSPAAMPPRKPIATILLPLDRRSTVSQTRLLRLRLTRPQHLILLPQTSVTNSKISMKRLMSLSRKLEMVLILRRGQLLSSYRSFASRLLNRFSPSYNLDMMRLLRKLQMLSLCASPSGAPLTCATFTRTFVKQGSRLG